jgi:hypothetical protein
MGVSFSSIAAGSHSARPGRTFLRHRRQPASWRCAGAFRFRRRAISSLRRDPPAGVVWQHLDPARFAAATGVKVLPVVVEATAAPVPDDGLIRERAPSRSWH